MNIHEQRADVLADLHRHEEAIQELYQAIAEGEDGVLVRLKLSENMFQLGQIEKAENEISEAIRLNPESALPRFYLAQIFMGRSEWNKAEEAARQAVSIDPETASYWGILALSHSGQGRWREAEEAVREAMRLEPDGPHHFGYLSYCLFQQDRWVEAEEIARQGLRMDSSNFGCADSLALALLAQGAVKDAFAINEGLLARKPDTFTCHAIQAWICLQQGNGDQANEWFREAKRFDKNPPEADLLERKIREIHRSTNGNL